MSGFAIFVSIWLTIISFLLWYTMRVVAVLARDRLRASDAADEAKRILQWGLEQRKQSFGGTRDGRSVE